MHFSSETGSQPSRPDGEIEGVYKKHVLWDYEYTLFEPGNEPYQALMKPNREQAVDRVVGQPQKC